MVHQIAFRQYYPKTPHHYGHLFISSNDAHSPCAYNSVLHTSNPESRNEPCYIKSITDYVKNLVTKTEDQQNAWS